jgi:hypothetical protein
MRTHPELKTWLRIVLTALLGAIVCLAAYWMAAVVADSAIVERAATCVSDGCFCEADAHRFPDQVVNAISSFGFVFLGIWALLATRQPVRGTRERTLKPFFAITMLFLGVSSFFYHATLSFLGQFLDIFSMYTFGILLAVGALYRSAKIGGVVAILTFAIASICFGLVQFAFPEARRILFALLLLPGIILEVTPWVTGYRPTSRQVRFIYVGVGVMAIAYLIWWLDQTPAFCDSASLLQGHGLWHVLTAVAAFMIFSHYRQTAHGPK